MPGDYTAPDTLVVGDPVRETWIAALLLALTLLDDRDSERPIHLQAAVAGVASATYVDVPYPVEWVAVETGNLAIKYYSRATDAATAVQMSLYCIEDVGTVADSESTPHATTSDWVTETVIVAVEAGKSYRLQIKGANATNPVIGYATAL